MTLEAQVLTDESVRATEGGCEIDLHLPWYRALPISCIEGIELVIDGQQIAREAVRVRYTSGGQTREGTLDDLVGRSDDQWFVQDALTAIVPLTSALNPGNETEVDVTLATRIPYIMIGPETALVQRTRAQRKVVTR